MKKIFSPILLGFITVLTWAQGSTLPTQYDGDQWWNEEVLSTEGKEFYVTFMKNYGKEIKDKDFFISVYATAYEGANVTVSGQFTPLDGSAPRPWDSTFYVGPGGVNDIIVPHEVGYMEIGGKTSADVQMKGLTVTADNRIALYSSNSNKSSYDATVIYPIQALYKEYVIQTYSQDQQATEFALVSSKNNNIVDIHVKETSYDIFTGQVIKEDYKTITVPLNKGESYLYRTEEGHISLTGTTICASEPIAIFQGGQIASVPTGTSQTSHIYTQTIPTDAWGKKYIITRTYNQSEDLIRFTAAEVNTKIYKDNNPNPIAILQPRETYEELINWNNNPSGAIVYTSSKAVECYLYQTGKESSSIVDAPSYTEMTPIEHSIHRTLFATFKYRYNATNELLLDNYVNVVIPSAGIGSLKLDGVIVPSTSFQTIGTQIDGKEYAYAQLPLDEGAHTLYCDNEEFIAHVYGFKKSQLGIISYSYSAGRNVLHPAWMLINGQQTNKYEICEGDPPVTFTSIINDDYTSIEWKHTLGGTKSGVVPAQSATGDSVYNWQYIVPDHTQPNWKDTVYMIVSRQTPICENFIIDTIKAIVQVNDTFMIEENQYKGLDANVCFSRTDSFEVHLKGETLRYIPDPSVPQYYNGELIHLEYDKPYLFVDSLLTNSHCDTCLKCDSIIYQVRILRHTYDTLVYDTVCYQNLPYEWHREDNGALLKKLTKNQLYNKHNLHITSDHVYKTDSILDTVRLTTIYGCDSIVRIKLIVLPDFYISDGEDEVCIDSINGYAWYSNSTHHHTNSEGIVPSNSSGITHNIWVYNQDTQEKVHLAPGQKISQAIPGTYILTDSMKTHGCQLCDDAMGCDSVHYKKLVVRHQKQKPLPDIHLCDNQIVVALNDTLCVGYKYKGAIPEPWKSANRYVNVNNDTILVDHSKTQDLLQCDSLTYQRVLLCPSYEDTLSVVSLCQGQTEYDWTREDNGQLIKKITLPVKEHYPFDTIYTDTLTTKATFSCTCDSILHLPITIYPIYDTTTTVTLCESEMPYIWELRDNENHDKTITIPDSEKGKVWHHTEQFILQTIHGCDSVVHLDLTVKPTLHDTINHQICPEQLPYSYCSGCDKATEAGIYYDTIPSKLYDCDSIVTHIITVSEEIRTLIDTVICNNELPYNHPTENNHLMNLMQTGVYYDTIRHPNMCDSILELHLLVHDTTTQSITYYHCVGEVYTDIDFPTITSTTDTSYVKRLTKANVTGCDSIVTVTVLYGDTFEDQTDTIILCESEGSYVWETSDTHSPIPYQHPFTWGNLHEQILDTTLYDTLHTIAPFNCDSIVSRHIIVKPTRRTTVPVNLCPEMTPYEYGVHGKKASMTGIYRDTTVSVLYGCDSITTYDIFVSEEIRTLIDTVICNNELPYNHPTENNHLMNLMQTGVYYDTIRHPNACDSILELHLVVHDTTTQSIIYYHCVGEVYTDIDFPTITSTTDTSYVKRLTKANITGCDSIVDVTVLFGDTFDVQDPDVTLCEQEYQYEWHTSDSHGNYTDVLSWGDLQEKVLDTVLYRTLHTVSPFECDSTTHIHITVYPTTVDDQSVVWCASAGPYSYGENGKVATASGDYIDTLITKNHYGCDSVLHLHFEWKDSIYYHDTVRICENKAFEKHGKLYVGDLYTAFGGTYDASNYDSVSVYTTGIHYDTITFYTSIGCDSSYYIVVDVQPIHYSTQERNVCQFEEVEYEAMHNGLGGLVSTSTLGDVVYVDTIPALGNGCDSIVQMTYHIRPHYHFSQGDIVLCQADSMWIWYNEDGDPQDTISLSEGDKTYNLGRVYKTVYGCDSTFGINVYIALTYHFYDTLTLCENDSLQWQGMQFIGSQYEAYGKTYSETGFDSTRIVTHGTYQWHIMRPTIHGCDSTYHLILYVNEVAHTDSVDSVCQGHPFYNPNWNWGEGMYMNTDRVGTYISVDTILSLVTGCDSIVTLTLRVDSVYDYRPYFEFCQDTINTTTVVEWEDEAGELHTFRLDISKADTLTFTDSLTSIHGCDSVFGVTWLVHPIYRFDTIIHLCEDERFVWQDTLYTGDSVRTITPEDSVILSPGIYHRFKHFTTVMDCDSDYYATIYVHAIYDTLTRVTVCESDGFVWHQQDCPKGICQTYVDTLVPVAYCDTIRILPHEALYPQLKRDTLMRYHERMLQSIYGCDSLSRIWVTVQPTYCFLSDTTICANERVKYRGKYFSSKDTTYIDRQYTEDGCDSVYILRLHVRPIFMNVRRVIMCDNEALYHKSANRDDPVWTPGDEIRDPEWEYYDMIYTDKNGCDSIYRYYLTIYPSFKSIDSTVVLCSADSILLHGNTYVGEKTEYPVDTFVLPFQAYYADTLRTIHNCDSIYGIFASVYPSYRHTDTITICDNESADWRSHHYAGERHGNASGDGLPAGEHIFRDTLRTKEHGCDSIYELHLIVHPTYLFEENMTKCADEDLTWRSFNLDHLPVGEHFFYDSLSTVNFGCDSVYHLYLTVNDTTSEVRHDTVCRTETYDFHGVSLMEPGYYYDTTLNEWGCHHFTHLHLYVIEPTVPTAWADSICANDSAYDLFYTYTGVLDPIAYSLYYDDDGHANGFEDIINHPIETPDELYWLTIPMPRVDVDRTNYPRPDYYNIKLVLDNGICTNPDLCSTDTNVVLSYPSWITRQRFGDVIALYNEKYNGGYKWDAYQWYHGDTLLPGETHEYLYVPTGLVVGDQYHVRLTREGEVGEDRSFQTCPITIVGNPIDNDFAPTQSYLSVVQTCVCSCHPYIQILSRKDGMYRITYNGLFVKEGVFRADVTEVEIPSVEGMYVVQLWSPDTPEEPYRSIKVFVNSQCPNYEHIPF